MAGKTMYLSAVLRCIQKCMKKIPIVLDVFMQNYLCIRVAIGMILGYDEINSK